MENGVTAGPRGQAADSVEAYKDTGHHLVLVSDGKSVRILHKCAHQGLLGSV